MLRLILDRVAPPAQDTALSAAILRRVASSDSPPTLRLWSPERSVAFGRQDAVRAGYLDAIAACRDAGFVPVERLAGGRAAVFHEGTIAFSWAMPESRVRETIADRFRAVASIVVDALEMLGLDARIGEVPGEYCPGDWSVNLGGTRKVMGVGQRLVRGAAHVGGVVVVTGRELINRPLIPIYAALGYDWDPEATGAVVESAPSADVAGVTSALTDAFERAGHSLEPGHFDDAEIALAVDLTSDHDPKTR